MAERFMESVKCFLTTQEKLDIGAQQADAVNRVREAEADLKSVQTRIKAQIAADEAIIVDCAEKYRSGYDFRKVECEEVKDFEAGVANVIRLDTYEVVRSRKLDPKEYQKELPLEEGEQEETVVAGGDRPEPMQSI